MAQLQAPVKSNKNSAIAKAIVTARKKQGLTLREVSTRAEISHQSVFRLERGAGGIDAAIRVMNVLGFKKKEKMKLLNGHLLTWAGVG